WHDVAAASLSVPCNSPIERRLSRANVPLWHLGKKTGFDPRMFGAIDHMVREFQPQVVHTHLSVLRYVFPVLIRRHVDLAIHTLHNAAERESDNLGRFLQWFAFRRTVIPVAISQDGAASFK